MLAVTGLIMAVLFLLAQQAIWVSPWGSRFQQVASLAAFVTMALPWALMLPPLLKTDVVTPVWRSILIAGALTVILLISAFVHARCAVIDMQAKSLDWPTCRIDLRKHLIRRAVSQEPTGHWAIAPAMVGGLSVVLFQLLRSLLPAQTLVLGASLGVLAGTAWICAMPLARALGQGWQLQQIERQSGSRFKSDQCQRLNTERMKSALGRWWSRRQPN
ncbi:hypothetical protein EIP75_04495 [Aquabacterium soli]|uniref:Uncharacterized protein n=1 Tax=Aquabacterium soli TaxID=2493092 RepID=A0A426VF60_9BURK|nr:hypothetical protein [Aquabacterium soli]RRS05475.1 hypothetical protein EIP75_04495 [Aquabacterium soli]